MGIVFLSYSRQDRERVRELYADLKRHGFQIWFDEENLLPGQIWATEIKKAIREASLVLVVFRAGRSLGRARLSRHAATCRRKSEPRSIS
jgi:hypothetical protein